MINNMYIEKKYISYYTKILMFPIITIQMLGKMNILKALLKKEEYTFTFHKNKKKLYEFLKLLNILNYSNYYISVYFSSKSQICYSLSSLLVPQ